MSTKNANDKVKFNKNRIRTIFSTKEENDEVSNYSIQKRNLCPRKNVSKSNLLIPSSEMLNHRLK